MDIDIEYMSSDFDPGAGFSPSPSPAASPDPDPIITSSPVPEEGIEEAPGGSSSSDEFVQNDIMDQTPEPDPNLQTEILYDDSVIITKLEQIHMDLMLVICVLVLLLSRSILSAYRRKASRR